MDVRDIREKYDTCGKVRQIEVGKQVLDMPAFEIQWLKSTLKKVLTVLNVSDEFWWHLLNGQFTENLKKMAL